MYLIASLLCGLTGPGLNSYHRIHISSIPGLAPNVRPVCAGRI